MSLMDRVKESYGKAKDEVTEFAETAKIKHEISQLHDRKAGLLTAIGNHVYAQYGKGQVPPEVESQCREIQAIDNEIKSKSDEIARINAA